MGSAGHRRRAPAGAGRRRQPAGGRQRHRSRARAESSGGAGQALSAAGGVNRFPVGAAPVASFSGIAGRDQELAAEAARSEEHTSELQSLMRISYAVFCLKKKKQKHNMTIKKKQENTKKQR